jgi:toxin ParE1/3/4
LTPANALEVHPDARRELTADIVFYAERSLTVAVRFREAIRAATAVIRESPERGPAHIHGTRRLVLQDFPYSVVYKASPGQVTIYAFAHAKRRPDYWRSRLAR